MTMKKPSICFALLFAVCLTRAVAYSAASVPQSISSKYLTGNTDQDTMMYIFNSLASSGTQACNAILQTTLGGDKGSGDSLKRSQIDAMQTIWKIHCSQMNQHLDTTTSLVCPTLSKAGAGLDEARIAEAQTKLRECMSSVDHSFNAFIDDDADNPDGFSSAIVCYQQNLMELFDLETEEFLVNAKSSVDKKVWDKMNKDFMSKGGDMGAFIHFMGEDNFRNGWGKGQPAFLWNFVFSKDLQKFAMAFGQPMEILEKSQPALDLAYYPSIERPTPWSVSEVSEEVIEEEPASETVKEKESAAFLEGVNGQDPVKDAPRLRKRDRIKNIIKRVLGRKVSS